MRRGTVLAHHLTDLEFTKLPDHDRPDEQTDHQRAQARRGGAKRDVSSHVQHRELRVQRIEEVIQHQAYSALRRSTTTSVPMPRDPLTSTRSPGRVRCTARSAASPLVVTPHPVAAAIPLAIASSARVLADGPPTAISRSRPAAAAAAPHSRCSRPECVPSSSISPSTAILRALPVATSRTCRARRNADGLELYESSISVRPPGRRSSSPRWCAGCKRAARSAIASSGTSNSTATALAASTLARLP